MGSRYDNINIASMLIVLSKACLVEFSAQGFAVVVVTTLWIHMSLILDVVLIFKRLNLLVVRLRLLLIWRKSKRSLVVIIVVRILMKKSQKSSRLSSISCRWLLLST